MIYDVVVVGGGTAGCAAAYIAGKLGLKTLLIEKNIHLGGTITSGLVIPVMKSGNSQINTEFRDALIDECKKLGGQTTYQFLVRFRQDVVELKPDVVVIMAGTNDIAENIGPYCEENTLANINTMVDIAEANGIRAVLSSVLPAGGFLWNRAVTDAPERIARLNGKIKACAEERGLDFIDFHSEMIQGADGAGNRDSNHGVSVKDGFSVSAMNPEYTEDGVHPLPEGYEVMERILLRHIVSVEGENNR